MLNRKKKLFLKLVVICTGLIALIVLCWIAMGLISSRRDKSEFIAQGRMRMREHFAERQIDYPPARVLFLFDKSAALADLFVASNEGEWRYLVSYSARAKSGRLGPKLKEGDRQIPEGVYQINFLNRRSRYHLSLRLNYPNEFDIEKARVDGRTNLGSDIMIHGSWVSIGCIALGDSNIEEVYALAEDTGMKNWQVLISPSSPFLSGLLAYRRDGEPSWYGELLASITEVIKREALPEPSQREIR